MSKYKNYFFTKLGVKNVTKANDKQPLNEGFTDSVLLSPTAIPTPIIGMAVRGSSSGGLPSRADRLGDITPNKLGGYKKIEVDSVNSRVVDKTPVNPEIQQGSTPINNDTDVIKGGVSHPHQIQQGVDKISQDVSSKSINQIPVDLPQQRDVNGTFARHKELMLQKLKLKECGKGNCDCDCNSDNTEVEVKESADAEETSNATWKTDSNKGGLVKVGEAFERMKGLAGIGEVTLSSNGMWKSSIQETKPEANKSESNVSLEKLKTIKAKLESKLKSGKLSDKETSVLQKINLALSNRGEG